MSLFSDILAKDKETAPSVFSKFKPSYLQVNEVLKPKSSSLNHVILIKN